MYDVWVRGCYSRPCRLLRRAWTFERLLLTSSILGHWLGNAKYLVTRYCHTNAKVNDCLSITCFYVAYSIQTVVSDLPKCLVKGERWAEYVGVPDTDIDVVFSIVRSVMFLMLSPLE